MSLPFVEASENSNVLTCGKDINGNEIDLCSNSRNLNACHRCCSCSRSGALNSGSLLSGRQSFGFSISFDGNGIDPRGRNGRKKELPALALQSQRSFHENFGHAVAEALLLLTVSFQLFRYGGIGYRWNRNFLALAFYGVFLLPAVIQVGCYYLFSKRVHRNIVYGRRPRNRLDIYMPETVNEPKPVVALVTGGAWVIGHKAWGSLLAQGLAERDVIVACIDYRNFPQGTISDMIMDVSEGISFVLDNIAEYGGDPDRIYLMGQSAGAHIAACALVDKALKDASSSEEVSWRTSQIQAFFGISGGYNLVKLVEHFHRRGLYRSLFLRIMEGEKSLSCFSPELMIQNPSFKEALSFLPPIALLHGTGDYSIPWEASTNFADALRSVGVQPKVMLYDGKTHTDLFMQDPMRGGKDQLLEDILSFIHSGDPPKHANAASRRRLVPEILLTLASKVSPL